MILWLDVLDVDITWLIHLKNIFYKTVYKINIIYDKVYCETKWFRNIKTRNLFYAIKNKYVEQKKQLC